MAKRPTVTTVSSGYASTTALNDNFTNVQDAFDNTLSLDGSTPNAMGADLDLNSNDILNGGAGNFVNLFVNGVALTSSTAALAPVAADVVITDAGGYYTGSNVEAALQEVGTFTQVTATVAELNKLDGVTATTAELNKLDGVGGDVVGTTDTQTLTNKTLTDATLSQGIVEDTYAASITGSVALDTANGTLWDLTMTGNVTFTDSVVAGESILLLIDDGTAYTITWPTITWVNNGGTAPTLATTGDTVISVWKIGSTLYGALVGDGS